MWDFNDDIRWCANLALGCAFVIMFGGVILSAYLIEGRTYTLIMFGIMALLFALVGAILHGRIWLDKKDRVLLTKIKDDE